MGIHQAQAGRTHSIIGVLHLLPLPGAPRFTGDTRRILAAAQADADALADGGVDAVMIENFGDTPYWGGSVPAETIAWMTRIGGLIADRHPGLPLGVCVLRNDARAALAVAHAVGAGFIRVCVLGYPRVADQGLLTGAADLLLRDRARLGADVRIYADVDVKHSYPLAPLSTLQSEAVDLVTRCHADAVIVTGRSTGSPVKLSDLQDVCGAVSVPVFIGSGVTAGNAAAFAGAARGFIIGSALKESAEPGARVVADRVRAVVQQIRSGLLDARSESSEPLLTGSV